MAGRINRFLDPESGDNFQVVTAMQSFERGGWSGLGPGEGIMKRVLPDSHTDFVFAVVGEEFGILLCLLLVTLFSILVMRGLLQGAAAATAPSSAWRSPGWPRRSACRPSSTWASTCTCLPTKGMTLPFISYGGSALLSSAVTMGFLLALSRRSADQHVTVVPRQASLAEA